MNTEQCYLYFLPYLYLCNLYCCFATGQIISPLGIIIVFIYLSRWIDHRRKAVSCLANSNYRSIVTHLQSRQDEASPEREKIRAMLRLLTSEKFVLNMALYQDLLSALADLSLQFQGDQLPLSSVRSSILAAQAALQKQTEKPGPYLRPVLECFISALRILNTRM